MSTILSLIEQPLTFTATSNGHVFSLDINKAIPIDAFDQIEGQIWVQNITNASSQKMGLLTSMWNTIDGISADVTSPYDSVWIPSGTDVSLSGTGIFKFVYPESGYPLLRYLRWRLTMTTSGDTITLMMSALARRKSF